MCRRNCLHETWQEYWRFSELKGDSKTMMTGPSPALTSNELHGPLVAALVPDLTALLNGVSDLVEARLKVRGDALEWGTADEDLVTEVKNLFAEKGFREDAAEALVDYLRISVYEIEKKNGTPTLTPEQLTSTLQSDLEGLKRTNRTIRAQAHALAPVPPVTQDPILDVCDVNFNACMKQAGTNKVEQAACQQQRQICELGG
jgi:hypothetical protein